MFAAINRAFPGIDNKSLVTGDGLIYGGSHLPEQADFVGIQGEVAGAVEGRPDKFMFYIAPVIEEICVGLPTTGDHFSIFNCATK